jgi:sialic acid synthase SpsE
MFGVALGDKKRLNFFAKIKVDFIKILSEDFFNHSLIKEVLKSNVPFVYLSTGSILTKDIIFFIKKLKKSFRKKISIIYTKFSDKIYDIELNNIKKYKRIHPYVSYGNHSHNLSSVYRCMKYNPYSIFFYIKSNRVDVSHPDEKHAIRLQGLNQILKKIGC